MYYFLSISVWALLFVVFALLFWIVALYNKIEALRFDIKAEGALVDSYYKEACEARRVATQLRSMLLRNKKRITPPPPLPWWDNV